MIFPHTESRRIILRPATAADQARFAVTRLRSGVESFRPGSAQSAHASSGLDAAFVVERRSNGAVLGFTTLHGLDPAGHIRCGIYLDPKLARFGAGSEAIHLTVNYAFATFNVDRVITQTTEASFRALGMTTRKAPRTIATLYQRLLLRIHEYVTESRLRHFEINGVLHDHLFFRGRHFDLHNFRITRLSWESYIDRESDSVLPASCTWRSAPPRPGDAATSPRPSGAPARPAGGRG